MRRSLLLAPLVIVFAVANARGQAPAVAFCSPFAVAPGAATDVVFYGDNLASPAAMWTSFPGSYELTPGVDGNGTQPKEVRYRFTVPAEVPVGIHGYRIVTPGGVSSVRLLMVDDLPTAVDNSQNKTLPAAQPLTIPTAVEGACEPESFDYYKFTAVAGQRVSVDAVARRLGSPLDPVIRLLDATGRELAFSDDEGGIGPDARLAHTFEAAGEYFIEIRDVTYAGSGGHRYRLRIGDFPLASVAYPTGVSPAATLSLVPAGDSASPGEVLLGERIGRTVLASARRAAGAGSTPLTVVASGGLEEVEFEPNDALEAASPVALGSAISGRFAAANDRDCYAFDAKAGQRWLVTGLTRSLGSPTDLFMRLFQADGKQLTEVDDAGTDEGTLDFTAPADGRYVLAVEDLHHRGGPQHVYRLESRPYAPGFTLAVEVDKIDAPHGGVAVLKVTSARRDYNGPITLELVGAGEGLAFDANGIAEGQNETTMRITFPAALAPGAVRIGRVVGRAKIGEQMVEATASTLAALRGQFAGLPYPPAVLDGSLGVGIGPAFGDFFKLAVEGDAVRFAQLVGAGTGKIKVERLAGFDDAVSLAVESLPAGFAAEVKPIEKGKPEVELVVRGPAGAAAGDYRFKIVGSAAFQNQPKALAIDAVLRVRGPLDAAATVPGPLMAGGTQKCKVTLGRFGDDKQPVALTLTLPPGVTAPEGLTIAPDANELEFDLTAAADAAVGAHAIQITATTTVQGKAVTATASVPLEVKKE